MPYTHAAAGKRELGRACHISFSLLIKVNVVFKTGAKESTQVLPIIGGT